MADRKLLLHTLGMCAAIWLGGCTLRPAHAQPSMAGGHGAGQLGLAVVFPHGTTGVKLVARRSDERDVQAFTDDGSLAFDFQGDGEYWALINPVPGETKVYISGRSENLPVWHEETITVPGAWISSVYPVTLLATRNQHKWELRRVLTSPLPAPTPGTGSGVTGFAGAIGLSAFQLTAIWGLIAFAIIGLAVLRSAILQARQGLEPRDGPSPS